MRGSRTDDTRADVATTHAVTALPARTCATRHADTAAWTELWQHLEGDLVRYLTYLLAGDAHTAEDVAQETAIRLWQHPEILANGQSLAGWLRTVARNIVIDRIRRRNARPAEVALGPRADRPGPDPTNYVTDAAAISTMISGLSPLHRDVILRVYVQDRAIADVATDLGIPAGTVKSRCHTAVHQLRALWTGNLQSCA